MTMAATAISLVQAPVEPHHPWDAVVAALNAFYLRVLGLPEQASSIAARIDHLHFFEITAMFAAAGVIGIVSLVFVIRYRRRWPDQVGQRVRPPRIFEISIYCGLFALFMLFWVIGFRQYSDLELAPEDALDVYVTAKQWMWKYSYPDGPASVGVLYVPTGQPVRLYLTSRDVIHSFFVPEFRIKRDAVPGTYTTIWFEAMRPGRYPVLCAELCGVGHSHMRSEVVVLTPEDFEDWLRGRPALGPPDTTRVTPYEDRSSGLAPLSRLAELGRAAAARHGCLQCHSVDGSALRGPTWLNLYGAWQLLQTGEVVFVDPAYITQSMMDPTEKIVAGYPRIMPSFLGQITPAETAAIIEYMKALSPTPGLRRGRAPTAEEGAIPDTSSGDAQGTGSAMQGDAGSTPPATPAALRPAAPAAPAAPGSAARNPQPDRHREEP